MCDAELSDVSPLRVSVSVTNTTVVASQPRLQGQLQADAQQNGTFDITDLSLVALPGVYNVSVSLPDYPQVNFALPMCL